jgi:hypothetical protein
VHDGVNLVLDEDAFQLRAVGKIDLAENGRRRDSGEMTLQQAVQSNDGHAARG